MTAEVDYRRLVALAVEREMDVLGTDQATSLANDVEGLIVTDDGEVESLTLPGETVLAALVETYTASSGEIAAFVIARRLENAVDDPSILPENVRRHI